MPRILLRLAVICALLIPTAGLAQRPIAPLQEFPTEQQAQTHCPSDIVVWLNLPTGIYHLRVNAGTDAQTAVPMCANTKRIKLECGKHATGSERAPGSHKAGASKMKAE